jgi:hypothetical protein
MSPGAHESIRAAAKRTVEVADEVQPLMHLTKDYPLAQQGQVIFYVLSDAGIFTTSASEADLSSHRSPFSKLGDSVQSIITEYRRIQETTPKQHSILQQTLVNRRNQVAIRSRNHVF